MRSFPLFVRSLKLLAPKRQLAWTLVAGDIGVALFRLAEPVFFGHFVDALYAAAPGRAVTISAIRNLALLWIVVSLAGIALAILVSLFVERMVHVCRWHVSERYFAHVLRLSPSFHARQHSGVLAKTMYDANSFLYHSWLEFFREHIPSLVSLTLLVPLAVYLNWQMSLVIFAALVAFVAITITLSKRTSEGQRTVHAVDMAITDHIQDVVGNVPLVQSFTRIQAEIDTFSTLTARFIAAQFPILNVWAVASVVTRACSTLTVVAVFVLGTFLLERGVTSVGEIVTFAGFAALIIARLDQLSAFVGRLMTYRPALAKFFEVMDAAEMTIDGPAAIDFEFAGDVVFDGIWFEHEPERPILRDVSFHVPRGSLVALVGSTGAGKSTAMALLCRFWEPRLGQIRIDGVDIRDIRLAAMHRQIGVVFQDNPILHRSLGDNLRIGNPHATDEELEDVTNLVQLENFVARQESRFDAMLGERGRNISGGERQRLGIARALLKCSPILILDEATSALDAVTEGKIQRLISERRHQQTTFVIAHRLSTVRQADLILVMDEGRVVESGDFHALMAAQGHFARLVQAQSL